MPPPSTKMAQVNMAELSLPQLEVVKSQLDQVGPGRPRPREGGINPFSTPLCCPPPPR